MNFTYNTYILCSDALSSGELWGVLQQYRLSLGFGLLLYVGIGRVELNYCVPLKAQSSDR